MSFINFVHQLASVSGCLGATCRPPTPIATCERASEPLYRYVQRMASLFIGIEEADSGRPIVNSKQLIHKLINAFI